MLSMHACQFSSIANTPYTHCCIVFLTSIASSASPPTRSKSASMSTTSASLCGWGAESYEFVFLYAPASFSAVLGGYLEFQRRRRRAQSRRACRRRRRGAASRGSNKRLVSFMRLHRAQLLLCVRWSFDLFRVSIVSTSTSGRHCKWGLGAGDHHIGWKVRDC
jgi:hypothetical protein